MKSLLLPLILLFCCTATFAQKAETDKRYNYNYIHKHKFNRDVDEYFDFTKVDRRVHKTTYSMPNATKMASSLLAEYETDIEKVRAIYVWITNNIKLDLKKQQNPPKRDKIKCKSDTDCKQKFKEQIDIEIRKTVNRRKGNSEDYARLFARLMDLSDIEGGYIEGKTKVHNRAIGREPRGSNHSWNWAKIDGKVYFFDAMLGSGFTDSRYESYQKSYNELYFMVRPEKMILTHFPQEVKDQHTYPAVTKEQFGSYPLFENNAKLLDNIEFSPQNGFIKVSPKNNVIEFKFKFGKEVIEAQISPLGAASPTDMQKDKDGYFVLKYTSPKRVPKTIKVTVKTDYGQTFDVLTYKLKKVADEE
jgi:hypothetical protein